MSNVYVITEQRFFMSAEGCHYQVAENRPVKGVFKDFTHAFNWASLQLRVARASTHHSEYIRLHKSGVCEWEGCIIGAGNPKYRVIIRKEVIL